MKVLVVYHEKNGIVAGVEQFLNSRSVEIEKADRDDLKREHYIGKGLVVVVGGDGTFLKASQLNRDVPVIGINQNPEKKEGFFMQANPGNFKEKIDLFLQGKAKSIKLLQDKRESR